VTIRFLLPLVALLATLLTISAPRAETACLVIAEAASGTVVHQEGTDCDVGIGPASTFKLTLAVIGFDAGILTDPDHPAWPYKKNYQATRAADRQTVTPLSWMRDSVFWYSRVLVRELGADRFAQYVAKLDYGNADVSGEPGADNGMTHAWLNSSLMITPMEQLRFVRRLILRDLPVSVDAGSSAVSVTPRFQAGNWVIQGKTGTGYQREPNGTLGKRQYGWFIGWAMQDERLLAFAYLVKDTKAGQSAAGPRARDDLIAHWVELAGE
jgi:beta-lactamase class D